MSSREPPPARTVPAARGWKPCSMSAWIGQRKDAAGTFGPRVRDLNPDVVIDMICFTLASARQLVEALRGQVQQFLHCGTIWAHGPSVQVPTVEAQPRHPFGEYGIQKGTKSRSTCWMRRAGKGSRRPY